MPRVLCTRPYASDRINGHRWTLTDEGMLSDPLAADVAALLCECPGYQLIADAPAPDPEPKRGPGRPRKDQSYDEF